MTIAIKIDHDADMMTPLRLWSRCQLYIIITRLLVDFREEKQNAKSYLVFRFFQSVLRLESTC